MLVPTTQSLASEMTHMRDAGHGGVMDTFLLSELRPAQGSTQLAHSQKALALPAVHSLQEMELEILITMSSCLLAW